jgi:hypothetical protein
LGTQLFRIVMRSKRKRQEVWPEGGHVDTGIDFLGRLIREGRQEELFGESQSRRFLLGDGAWLVVPLLIVVFIVLTFPTNILVCLAFFFVVRPDDPSRAELVASLAVAALINAYLCGFIASAIRDWVRGDVPKKFP